MNATGAATTGRPVMRPAGRLPMRRATRVATATMAGASVSFRTSVSRSSLSRAGSGVLGVRVGDPRRAARAGHLRVELRLDRGEALLAAPEAQHLAGAGAVLLAAVGDAAAVVRLDDGHTLRAGDLPDGQLHHVRRAP